MRFQHSAAIWQAHPTLAAGVISVQGVTSDADVERRVPAYLDNALARLKAASVGELPEIQAWRRAFAQMGLKPTQYRCASESLLRRLHKDGALPRIHPLVDLCNHISVSSAIPIAAFDLAQIAGDLEVRPATGTESYTTFAGEVEQPSPGEVIFADSAGQAHARRWTNRQSATSAIRDTTSNVLIVAEALHPGAEDDVPALLATLTRELAEVWRVEPRSAVLSQQRPDFDL